MMHASPSVSSEVAEAPHYVTYMDFGQLQSGGRLRSIKEAKRSCGPIPLRKLSSRPGRADGGDDVAVQPRQ